MKGPAADATEASQPCLIVQPYDEDDQFFSFFLVM
jgi:hypothetical protein